MGSEHRGLSSPMADPGIFDLSGQVAVITGGGTGIGRATAHILAAWGASVVVASRRTHNLQRVVQELEAAGLAARAIPADVRDPDACRALIDETVHHLDRLDILVNCAGGSRSRTDGAWTDEDWQNALDLNLSAAWVLSRHAAEHMAARDGGAIVNVSSAASLTPRPVHAPYGIAKAAVNHLTSVLAAEYGPRGVRINCVAPGLVKSEGFVRAMQRLGRDPDDQGGRVLIGRAGTPPEIAYPILFLVSRAASYIFGETLYVGGGPRYWSSQ
jgi:NAD(P)-dependent dehydrogenase (short-subunit alcohol dehydrogenase family)